MSKTPIFDMTIPLGNVLSASVLSTIIAAVLVSALVLLAILCLMRFRSRLLALSSSAEERGKALLTLSAELEAQALLSRQMSMDLEEMRKRLLHHEETVQADSPLWSFSSAPLNLNRRGQILRLSRKGKSVAEIAQDLNVAQGEVELLLKVHDLSQKTPRQEN